MAKGGFIQNTGKLIIEVSFPIIAGFLTWFFFTKIYPLSDGTNNTYLYPYGAAILGAGVAYFLALFITEFDESGVERGETLLPEWKVRFSSWWQTRNDPLKFFWGGICLPFSAGEEGLAAIGAPGSGKTLTIRLFLQSVLLHVGVVPDHRALIYDAKSDMLPIMSGMGVNVDPDYGLAKVLNPYDTRAWYWDICKDINDIKKTSELALLFIPVNPEAKQPMWDNRARSLLNGVLQAFVLTGKRWTLRDLCAATLNEKRLRMVLESCPHTKQVVETQLGKGTATEGVIFQLQSSMERFQGIAAIWDSLPKDRSVSLTNWLKDEKGSILLLGAGEDGTPLGDINKLIIARLGQLVKSSRKESRTRRTWIVVDELRQCGRLDLMPIGNMGRGFGASLVIGYQDHEGLKDAYTERGANELLGMCQHKAIFRLESSETAAWAAKRFGIQEITGNGQSKERPVVLDSQFMSLNEIPKTNVKNGLTGFYKSTAIGAYRLTITGVELFYKRLCSKDEDVEGIIDINPNNYPFVDWTDTDLEQFISKEKKQLPLPAKTLDYDLAEKTENPLDGIGREARKKSDFSIKKPPTDEELERGIQERGINV